MSEIKYPKQTKVLKRRKKTLAFEAELYPAIAEENDNPLEMHKGYSRFVATFTDNEGQTKIHPTANIPVEDIDYIKQKSDIALFILTLDTASKELVKPQVEDSKSMNPNNELSIAHTHIIQLGKFKGKTPAAILLQDKSQAEELANTMNFLLSKAEQYPANKIQAQAINEALELLKNGNLKPTEELKENSEETNQGQLNIAYMQKIQLGKFKGQTPAAILLHDKNQMEELIKTRDFLLQNANKYENNRVQAKAIDNAIMLLKTGALKQIEVPTNETEQGKKITIYKEEFKTLISTKDEENNYLVYSIEMNCDTAMNNPFMITITNWRAPIKTHSDGTINPDMQRAKNMIQSTLRMNEKEWVSTISDMQRKLAMFENAYFPYQLINSELNSYQHKNAKKSPLLQREEEMQTFMKRANKVFDLFEKLDLNKILSNPNNFKF